VKPVGKPDAGNPHVRFDERGWETGRRSASVLAPILDSTGLAFRPIFNLQDESRAFACNPWIRESRCSVDQPSCARNAGHDTIALGLTQKQLHRLGEIV
jgi:hypothetical protein